MKKEFKVIAQIIKNNKRVLDVGCGDGTLMEYLKINQHNDVRGLEPQKELVQKCISKGLSVIEGDAEKELIQFPENSFDYAILSQTLQAFRYPDEVLIYDITSANQYGKNFVIGETPLFPLIMLFHDSETEFPTGDMMPIPVITTLLFDIILPM